MALAQGGVGSRIRLGHIIHCMDVVHPVEGVGETEFLEHAGSIGFIAVGEDELAAGEAIERGDQRWIGREAGEIDVVDIIEEIMRLYAMRRQDRKSTRLNSSH